MSFNLKPLSPQAVIIRIGPKLDFQNAAEFRSTCDHQVESGVHNFILDFNETGILDSSGLGAIFALHRHLKPHNGQIVFADLSRPAETVIQLTRAYKVFGIYPTVEAARQAVTKFESGQ